MNENNLNENEELSKSPTMPPEFMPRNLIYAVILIPLALLLILFSGAKILGLLFAPPQFDEIGPGLRIFHQSLYLAAALAAIASSIIALTSSLNMKKFFTAGNRAAAVSASEKADKNGKFLPIFIVAFGIVVIVYIVQMFL